MNTYEYLRSRLLFDPCPRSLRFILSNIYFKAAGHMKAKFHAEPLLVGETKVCSNGPYHVTKIAAMPICGKNLLKAFLYQQVDYL